MKDLRILFREAAGDVFAVWRKEVRRVVHDQGALIFFILVVLSVALCFHLYGRSGEGSARSGG